MRFFISYSSKDYYIINQYRDTLKKLDYEIWMAPESIKLGESYAQAIPEGIDRCDYFLIFISSNSISSKWCQSEIDNAKNKGKKIIPIFIEDVKLNSTFSFYLNDSHGVLYSNVSNCPELNIKEKILPLLSIDTYPKANPFIKEYNEKLSRRNTNFNKIFTGLDIIMDSKKQNDYSCLDFIFDIYTEKDEEEFNLHSLINSNSKYILHGGAGIGKTTILKKLVIDIADHCYHNDINALPVYIELSKIEKASDILTEILKKIDSDRQITHLLTRETHLIIALDGLDEFSIESQESRDNLIEFLDKEIYEKYYCSFIIGCRTYGIPHNCDYKLVRVAPLSEKQILEFIHKYFLYFSIHIDEKTFYEQIKRIAHANEMEITPLILAIAIVASKDRHCMINSVDELYNIYIKKLLAKIKPRSGMTCDDYFYIASKIALEMLIKSRASLPVTDIQLITDKHIDDTTNDIVSSGLISIQDGYISFIHASIMEYLGKSCALQKFDFIPKESMDQYFLQDNAIIDKIVSLLNVKNTDTVMEVGAGIGSVASHFPTCKNLYLVDLDEGLCRILQYNFRNSPNAQIINGDALKALQEVPSNKIVSNLPFFLTHAVLDILKNIEFEMAIMSVKNDDSFQEYSDSLVIIDLAVIPGRSFFPKQPFDSRLILVRKRR